MKMYHYKAKEQTREAWILILSATETSITLPPAWKQVHNLPDDPSYPWRLDVNLYPPEFMRVAFVCFMEARRQSGYVARHARH